MTFPPGSVGHTLTRMTGVWHDHIEIYDLAGKPLAEDSFSGSPGPAPFDNLVYVEFDGERYRQTNVTFRGRPFHARTFGGRLVEGVLHFDRLGPQDPGHIGVSGGPGVLFFAAAVINEATTRYAEPDCVRLIAANQRTRSTLLYRDGKAVRTLTATGWRLAPDASRRVLWDPRGPEGAVHIEHEDTPVFSRSGQNPEPGDA